MLCNEGFNRTLKNQRYMYFWTEDVAKRGSLVVASCKLKFIIEVAVDWPELILV